MSTVIRPDTLRHICKQPLNEVRSVQLRGRGITRLVGVDACPNLTSLDVSWNALTELDSACLEECKELWVIDASHNRLESIGGLCSVMALGYLNLSNNPLPLESLRCLANTHILELHLGDGYCTDERRRTLSLLPNLWVLNGEFVTAQERRMAEDNYHHAEAGSGGGIQLLLTRIDSSMPDQTREIQTRSDHGASSSTCQEEVPLNSHQSTQKGGPIYRSPYGDLERQGRLTREFYEDVVWRLPSRRGAAESFRLATLLKRYDQRAATANTSAWVESFTRGGSGSGVRGCVRRDWSMHIPRPHLEALVSLPLELKLDVAILLAMRAAFRDSIPQQVLSEALLVLLVSHEGLPNCMHSDLARVPAFICTSLAHLLRSSILSALEKASMPGRTDTTAPPTLKEPQRDLFDALPPVITGVDVENTFESWEVSSWGSSCSNLGGRGKGGEEGGDGGGDGGGGGNAAAEAMSTGDTTGAVPDGIATSAPTARPPPGEEEAGVARSGLPGAQARPLGIGLTRLCRRAVILLTRSPTCPDLVAWQPGPMEQRTYDQMKPLLAKAHMSHRDLYPQSEFSHEFRGNSRTVDMTRGVSMASDLHSPSTPRMNLDYSLSGSEIEGTGPGEDRCSQQYARHEQSFSIEPLQTPDPCCWEANVRRPKAGERVQVLHDVWAAIIVVKPATFSVVVAPFDGIQAPPYRGRPRIDSRDLYYDSRGWWRHIPALNNTTPGAPGRLHRVNRGLSASGLPRGSGSLNEPLENPGVSDPRRSLSRCTSDGRPAVHVVDRPETDQQISPESTGAVTGRRRAFTAAPSPSSTTRNLAASRADTVASSPNSLSLAPAVLRHRCPSDDVGVFSAEGSWDPVFVVAPARLVGLQNQTAVREMGLRRALQVAWRPIEGPEGSVAPRPTMPRCSSQATSAGAGAIRCPVLQQSASTPAIPGILDKRPLTRWASVAPSHESSSVNKRFPRSAALSASSINTSSYSAVAAGVPVPPTDEAWLDLQKEMGSLKADNRMLIRGGSQNGSTGTGLVSKAQALLRTSGSAMSVMTRSFAENSTVCAEATADLLAKTLSLALDDPVSAWKGGRQENSPTTVFELTQVDGKPKTSTESVTIATCSTPVRDLEATPTRGEASEIVPQKCAVSTSEESLARAAAGEDQRALPHRNQSARCRRRHSQEGISTTATTPSTTWKPNAHRPLDWFPVPGRQVLLVDPNDVKAAATAAAAKATADREAAINSSEGDDFRTTGESAGGDECSQDRGAGRAPAQKLVRGGGEIGKRPEKTKSRQAEGRGGFGRDMGESRDRSEILLSARSGFPSAAVLADISLSPKKDKSAEARARGPSGQCKAPDCHAPASPANGVPPRKSSGALDLTSHSVHGWPERKPGRGAQHRTAHVSANASHCLPRAPVDLGVAANFDLAAIAWGDRPMASRSAGGRAGVMAVTGEGDTIQAGRVNVQRRRGIATGTTNTLTERDGGLQINQLRPGPKARLAGAPRLLRKSMNSASKVPQTRSAIALGWEPANNAGGAGSRRRPPVFKASKSGEVGSNGKMMTFASCTNRKRSQPRGRDTTSSIGREHGDGGINTWPASPWGLDTCMDECNSISSSNANSSINSCCGWMKTGSQS